MKIKILKNDDDFAIIKDGEELMSFHRDENIGDIL